MSLRDAMRAQWQEQVNGSLIEVKVPEWDDAVLYFKRSLTLEQRIRLDSVMREEGALAQCREFVFIAACDEDGKRLFSGRQDERMLGTQTDPDILVRVASQALEQISAPTMQEAEKN